MEKETSKITLHFHDRKECKEEAKYVFKLFGNWYLNGLRVRIIKFLINSLPEPNPKECYLDTK